MKKKIIVSIGDLNGIGIELALINHIEISKIIDISYCIDKNLLIKASMILEIPIPNNFKIIPVKKNNFEIAPSIVSKDIGLYSYLSFIKAIDLAKNDNSVDGIVTLPINKESIKLAGLKYKGHTDILRDIFNQNIIMMLGSPKMYVALYTDHIPLKDVSIQITNIDNLILFLSIFYKNIKFYLRNNEKIALLGLNPHAGDNGVLGDEDKIIEEASEYVNKIFKKKIYTKPLVPDIAFTKFYRDKYRYYVAMYHDQGLIPLKTLYFNESINISLNLPIKRTSVAHGTAFDIAYKRNRELNSISYLNALLFH